jgi:hypothetical protein
MAPIFFVPQKSVTDFDYLPGNIPEALTSKPHGEGSPKSPTKDLAMVLSDQQSVCHRGGLYSIPC